MKSSRVNTDFEKRVNKKCFHRRLYYTITGGLLALFVLLFGLYCITPLSHVKEVNISKEHVYISEIDENYFNKYLPSKVFLPTFNKKQYAKLVESGDRKELITSVKVKVNPFSIHVDYKEILPVFNYNNLYYLSSGNIVPSYLPKQIGKYSSKEYLDFLPEFSYAANIDSNEFKTSELFPYFSRLDGETLEMLDYVVFNADYSFTTIFKDSKYDFYYRINIPSKQISNIVSSQKLIQLEKTVHNSYEVYFQNKLKDDKIKDTDAKVLDWHVPEDENQIVEGIK